MHTAAAALAVGLVALAAAGGCSLVQKETNRQVRKGTQSLGGDPVPQTLDSSGRLMPAAPPYLVALLSKPAGIKWDLTCQGAIVTTERGNLVLLTAAHCFMASTAPDELTPVVGRDEILDESKWPSPRPTPINRVSALIHPDYKCCHADHDLAVVQLTEAAALHALAITASSVPDQSRAFGRNKDNRTVVEVLRGRKWPQKKCVDWWKPTAGGEVKDAPCLKTGNKAGENARVTKADSGGPVLALDVGDALVGVISLSYYAEPPVTAGDNWHVVVAPLSDVSWIDACIADPEKCKRKERCEMVGWYCKGEGR